MSIAYDQIVNDERLKDVDAVKNNWLYVIDTDIISRPGPRVVDAVKIIHADYADFFEEMEEGEEETIPPEITSQEPVDTEINNLECESRTFAISVDQSVDIVWQINGTEVQTDESVTEASYTNASAVLGTWNVSAIGTSRETGLSGIHTWVWNVTPALATTTPTPSVDITTTPSPTPSLIPTLTSTPTLVIISTSTPTPTPVPEEKQKSREEEIPEPSGFEVFFAVVGLLAVMYLLRRNGFKNA